MLTIEAALWDEWECHVPAMNEKIWVIITVYHDIDSLQVVNETWPCWSNKIDWKKLCFERGGKQSLWLEIKAS